MKKVCEHCHSEIEYRGGEFHEESHQITESIQIVDYYYIECPKCKSKIKI